MVEGCTGKSERPFLENVLERRSSHDSTLFLPRRIRFCLDLCRDGISGGKLLHRHCRRTLEVHSGWGFEEFFHLLLHADAISGSSPRLSGRCTTVAGDLCEFSRRFRSALMLV